MCLVIDACCIPKVFDTENQQHFNYAPVLEWVSSPSGKGRIIYGGTKYGDELLNLGRYRKIIIELKRMGRVVELPRDQVDRIAHALKAEITDAEINDEHLIAIVIASKCCVVCTDDDGAIHYLKRKEFYSNRRMKRPEIYHSLDNQKLCCRKNLLENYGE
ncbi:MAG: hypothetical protein DMG27_17405 [Acidobacteria bacterium]|nr:MAG: hypothetical protein DMG27_17405 [Acidobacteriota bacterium]